MWIAKQIHHGTANRYGYLFNSIIGTGSLRSN